MTCAQVWGPARGWGAHGGGVMRLRVGLLGFDPVDFPKGHFTNHMGPSAPPKDTSGHGSHPLGSLYSKSQAKEMAGCGGSSV